MKDLRVVVDNRERSSDVPRLLVELGMDVSFAQLALGDYVLSSDVAIERKGLKDFISSLYSGRLFKQISELTKTFKNSILLIEGDLSQIYLITPNVKSFFGALAHLILDSEVKIVFVEGPKESALFISSLAKRIATKRKTEKIPVIRKPLKESSKLHEGQLYLISALPGIGIKLAHKLLSSFLTPRAIFNASPSELAKVPGLGMVKAKKLYRFFNTPYRIEVKERVEQG